MSQKNFLKEFEQLCYEQFLDQNSATNILINYSLRNPCQNYLIMASLSKLNYERNITYGCNYLDR